MTTLRKLSSQVMRLLEAGPHTRDSKLSQQYVMTEVRQATNRAIKAEYFNAANAGLRDVSPLSIATYSDQAVQEDATSGRNYIDLPSYYINLIGGVGLQQVKTQTGNASIDKPMIIVNPLEIDMMSGSLFSLEIMKDQWIAEPDRNKIWFSERNDETLLDAGITEVELKIVVVDPNTIGEDDNYPVDPATENEIIMSVLQLHGYTAKESSDLINDGNPANK